MEKEQNIMRKVNYYLKENIKMEKDGKVKEKYMIIIVIIMDIWNLKVNIQMEKNGKEI